MADSPKGNAATPAKGNANPTPPATEDDWLSAAVVEEVSEEARPEDIPERVRQLVEESFSKGKKLRLKAPNEKEAQKLLRQLRLYADVRTVEKDGEKVSAPLTIRAPQVKDSDNEPIRNVVEFRAKEKEYRPRDNKS